MNVLVMGGAKTGTTGLSMAIRHALPQSSFHLEPKEIAFFEQPRLARYNKSMVVKIIFEHWKSRPHQRLAILMNECSVKFDHVIATVRDPRDALISRLFYCAYPVFLKSLHGADAAEAWLAVFRDKENAPADWSVMAMIDRLETLCGPLGMRNENRRAEHYAQVLRDLGDRAFIVRYEDFVAGQLDDLGARLGVPVHSDPPLGRFAYTRRTGQSGAWRKMFTPADVAVLRNSMREALIAGGYDPEDWQLEESPTLSPAEGSEYVADLIARAEKEKAPSFLNKLFGRK